MMPYLLIVLSLAGSPQFVMPMQDLRACTLNQAELTSMMNGGKAIIGCWDMSKQSFVGSFGGGASSPAPPGEIVD